MNQSPTRWTQEGQDTHEEKALQGRYQEDHNGQVDPENRRGEDSKEVPEPRS